MAKTITVKSAAPTGTPTVTPTPTGTSTSTPASAPSASAPILTAADVETAVANALKSEREKNGKLLRTWGGLIGNFAALLLLFAISVTSANTLLLIVVTVIYTIDLVIDVRWWIAAIISELSKKEVNMRFASALLNALVIVVLFVPFGLTPSIAAIAAIILSGLDTVLEVLSSWNQLTGKSS